MYVYRGPGKDKVVVLMIDQLINSIDIIKKQADARNNKIKRVKKMNSVLTCAKSASVLSGVRQCASACAACAGCAPPSAPTSARDMLTRDTAHDVSSLRARCTHTKYH